MPKTRAKSVKPAPPPSTRKRAPRAKESTRTLPPNTWGSYEVDAQNNLVRAELWVPTFIRKNERYRAFGKGRFARIILSAPARKFEKLVSDAVFFLWSGAAKVTSGTWRLRVVTVWPKLRHVGPDVPGGDSDASLSAIKDALQTSGFIDDDVRIVADDTTNLYRKGIRGLFVTLERVAYNVDDAAQHPIFARIPENILEGSRE